jgi:hypothetical protein
VKEPRFKPNQALKNKLITRIGQDSSVRDFVYAMSIERFVKFERMLFDVLGLSQTANATLTTLNESEVRVLASSWATLVDDMCDLDERKRLKEPKTNKIKIITVILDEPQRVTSCCCRKAARFAIDICRLASLDAFLVQIAAFFRLESWQVRRIYSLDGAQIRDIDQLIEHVSVCIASSSEKINAQQLKLNSNG